jgi:hypothetical protein
MKIIVSKIYKRHRQKTVIKQIPPTWVKGDGWFLNHQGKKIASFTEDSETITIRF